MKFGLFYELQLPEPAEQEQWHPMEPGGYDVKRGLKKAMWEEATREIINMMTQTPYQGYQGEFFSIPLHDVMPKPLQKPHPPLWVAASRRETTMLAARFGMGSLGLVSRRRLNLVTARGSSTASFAKSVSPSAKPSIRRSRCAPPACSAQLTRKRWCAARMARHSSAIALATTTARSPARSIGLARSTSIASSSKQTRATTRCPNAWPSSRKMRQGMQMPLLMRWPMLGANIKPGSVQAGQPEIEYIRDRFALSEATSYYEFALVTAIEHEA